MESKKLNEPNEPNLLANVKPNEELRKICPACFRPILFKDGKPINCFMTSIESKNLFIHDSCERDYYKAVQKRQKKHYENQEKSRIVDEAFLFFARLRKT